MHNEFVVSVNMRTECCGRSKAQLTDDYEHFPSLICCIF